MRAPLLVFAAAVFSGASAVVLANGTVAAPSAPSGGIAGTVSATVATGGGGGGVHGGGGGSSAGMHGGGVAPRAGTGVSAFHGTGLERSAHAGHGPISPGYVGHGGSAAGSHLNVAMGAPAGSAAEAARAARAAASNWNPHKPPHSYQRVFYPGDLDQCRFYGRCPQYGPYPYGSFDLFCQRFEQGGRAILVRCAGAVKSAIAPGRSR
jgi:hypothetical protein